MELNINKLKLLMNIYTVKTKKFMTTLPEKIQNLPAIIKSMSTEEQIAYGCIVLGLIFILIAIILW